MFTKCIIVVDEDCDVQDIGEVTLRVANNIDPERDIQFTMGPIDSLDHASRLPNYGSKMGIDATRKWAAEGFHRPWPPMIEMDVEPRPASTRCGKGWDSTHEEMAPPCNLDFGPADVPIIASTARAVD